MDHNQEQILKDLEEIGIGANEYHVKDDLPDIVGDSDVLKELLCVLREYHLHAVYRNIG